MGEDLAKVLLIDDEPSVLKVLKAALGGKYTVFTASSGKEGIDIVREENIDMVISDIKMDTMNGLEVLEQVKKINPHIMVLMMTAFASVETAVKAMKEGAFEYVIKPFKIEEVRLIVERALEQKRTMEENRYLKQELKEKYKFENLIGMSKSMQEVCEMISRVSDIDSTVLLYGESGTGKELVARAIHYNSRRKDKLFVTVDCGALAENILESELFGHIRGAFTGAFKDKDGLFEFANGGTIFLDEIGSVSAMMQAKLLRVLQEKEIKRVGDVKSRKIDTRVIAATNVKLEEKVAKGEFREDLFYRLNVIVIEIPPLRARKEDIPLLVKHFFKKFNMNKTLSPEVEELFFQYDWPGNVRELENIIERGTVLAQDVITMKDIYGKIKEKDSSDSILLKDIVDKAEADHITNVLKCFKGDKKLVAQKLGLDLVTLYRKMKKLRIKI